MRVRDEVSQVENSVKFLRQRRAALGAQQGDPDSPASSTLFGRRNRLQADLDLALQQDALPAPTLGELSISVHGRSIHEIRHEIKNVEHEIGEVQERIDEIDRQLAKLERKR